MKSRMFKAGLAGGLMAALMLTAGACGGDSGGGGGGGGKQLTLEAYFEKVDAADNKTEEKTSAISDSLADTEDVKTIQDAFAQFPDIIRDFLKEMERLNPPDEAKDAHEAAIEAGRNTIDEFDSVLDDVNAADTLEDVIAALDNEAFTAADEAFTETCVELQTIADDNEIDVQLDCGD